MIISKKQTGISLLFTGVLSGLLLTSCDASDNNDANRQRAPQQHRVEVTTVEQRAVFLTQMVSGTLEAVTRFRLYNEESGRITRLPYHEGDFVKKGTLLVQLDNELLKTDVAKARASKAQAKVDLDRLKKLLTKKISTEEEVAHAKTTLDLAIAEEKHQRTRLRRSSIKAPIDGLITERLFEPGDHLAAQSHIHSIIDPSALRLKASLAERWIPHIENDQAVSLKIDALGDKSFTAKVVRIHPTIDASTHKGIIEILLDPVPASAKVGQFSRAKLELRATDRLVIPVHAIHYEPEGAYVYRVSNDDEGKTVVKKVYFEQGQQFGAIAEILSGLKSGDQIVSRGYLGLRDGKNVTLANQAQTQPNEKSAANKK